MELYRIATIDAPDAAGLLGSYLEAPVAGAAGETHCLELRGWVLGRDAAVEAVEVIEEDAAVRSLPDWEARPLRTIALNVPRPDVGRHYPSAGENPACGFAVGISLIGMPLRFELLLQLKLADGRRLPWRIVRGTRRKLAAALPEDALSPLMLTYLGRSGSTWVMRLLAEHPAIVAHRVYPYETRAAGYWAHGLRTLIQPADHVASVAPNTFLEKTAWMGQHPYFCPPATNLPAVRTWFERDYPAEAAAFTLRSIEAFYRQVATSQGQPQPVYYFEKWGVRSPQELMWELYSHAREIILVRDPRDMLCSIDSFNQRRGYAAFGRQKFEEDAAFVTHRRLQAQRLWAVCEARKDRALILRYEDLILEPQKTVRRLLDYLKLDTGDIDGMLSRASADTPELQRHRSVANPRQSVGRWRQELSPQLKQLAADAFGELLANWGYDA